MSEEKPAEPFPINPVYSSLRIILWLVPVSFLIPGAVVMFVGQYLGLNETLAGLLGNSSSFLFLVGAGWCDYKLAAPGWKESFSWIGSVAFYIFCQVILVTIIYITLIAIGVFG